MYISLSVISPSQAYYSSPFELNTKKCPKIMVFARELGPLYYMYYM
jgi:hypothetical protein